jgi:ribokinase
LNSNFNVGKRINSTIHTSVGGMAANAASVAASLGSNAILFSGIGDDEIAQYLKINLEKFGVNTSHLDLQKGLRSPHCIIQVESDGQRTIISEKINFNYSKILHFLSENLSKVRIIYLDGYRLSDCDRLLEISKETRIPFIIDLDGYEGDSIDLEKLSFFDSIILNKSLLKQLTGSLSLKENKSDFRPLSSKKIICTFGEDGVETLYNGHFTKIPASKVEVVDTTGAGDTFAGAYLHGLEKDTPFLDNVENAVKIASKSTSFDGSLGLLMEDLKI